MTNFVDSKVNFLFEAPVAETALERHLSRVHQVMDFQVVPKMESLPTDFARKGPNRPVSLNVEIR
eukprot:CAMPEP_0184491040 /NCGR_PEP_ID=MMETSP0113_2-20130426/19496_1 /TAXON_ID=91329 /ORGANISM="Norrisiella sphaerica, Strain BC52" /LENGTH=64 /DNA_ID=CAMNT_0026875227 /DNA_START=492 /DNA_END=686 /DNA_ORIENTATION=-